MQGALFVRDPGHQRPDLVGNQVIDLDGDASTGPVGASGGECHADGQIGSGGLSSGGRSGLHHRSHIDRK